VDIIDAGVAESHMLSGTPYAPGRSRVSGTMPRCARQSIPLAFLPA
jgi:hypothetical protein